MGTQQYESLQDGDGLEGGNTVPHGRGVAGDPDESRLRQWAGCPTFLPMRVEPRPGGGVVNMVGPGQGYEYVYVQKRSHGQSLKDR